MEDDFKKVSDKVPQKLLLQKLRFYKINENLINWIVLYADIFPHTTAGRLSDMSLETFRSRLKAFLFGY